MKRYAYLLFFCLLFFLLTGCKGNLYNRLNKAISTGNLVEIENVLEKAKGKEKEELINNGLILAVEYKNKMLVEFFIKKLVASQIGDLSRK